MKIFLFILSFLGIVFAQAQVLVGDSDSVVAIPVGSGLQFKRDFSIRVIGEQIRVPSHTEDDFDICDISTLDANKKPLDKAVVIRASTFLRLSERVKEVYSYQTPTESRDLAHLLLFKSDLGNYVKFLCFSENYIGYLTERHQNVTFSGFLDIISPFAEYVPALSDPF